MFLRLTLFPLSSTLEDLFNKTGVVNTVLQFPFENADLLAPQFIGIEGDPEPVVELKPFREGTKLVICEGQKETLYGEDGQFGLPISYVTARELRNVDFGNGLMAKTAKDYFAYIPDDTRVVVWWQ